MRVFLTLWSLWLALTAIAGCRPPFARVDAVLDEGVVFGSDGQLRVGRLGQDEGRALSVDATAQSLSFVITAAEQGTHGVWVNLEQDGTVIARGHQDVVFSTDERPAQQMLLTTPCEDSSVCDDGLFCNDNGTGDCREGHCVRYMPCRSNVECATFTCNEETDSCEAQVDHAVCNEGQTDDEPFYCDPSQGCRPGEGCVDDDDCQGARNCVAQFVCSNNRCVEQGPLALQDGNECTRGSCRAPDGVIQEPRVDGELCTAAADGICVSGSCRTSSCGDGYVDVDVRQSHPVAEECDDGLMFNSDTVANACRTDCRRAYCGDGVTDPLNFEECDDGDDDNNDDCKNDCTLSVCGDGVQTDNEECDDGDDDNNDDCKNDCTVNRCYDGVIDFTEEECDDGNANPSDGCDACRRTEWQVGVTFGYGEGDSNARGVRLVTPSEVAVDEEGNVYWAETTASLIRRYDAASQKVSRVAGNGEFSLGGDGKPGAENDASGVLGLTTDGIGNLIFSDSDGNRVRRVDVRSGLVTTIAGTGEPGFSGDGQLGALSQLQFPTGVAVDGLGNVYIGDERNHRVRRIDGETGVITTIIGTGESGRSMLRNMSYDSETPGTSVVLTTPRDLALDGNRYLYVYDTRADIIIRYELATGLVRRWAGAEYPAGEAMEIGRPSTDANLKGITGIAVGPDHGLYYCDHFEVRRILPQGDTGGDVELVGFSRDNVGFAGDNWSPALSAAAQEMQGLAVGPNGNVVVADLGNQLVRELRDATGQGEWQVNTLVGERYGSITTEQNDRQLIENIFRIFTGKIGVALPVPGELLQVFVATELQHTVVTRASVDSWFVQFAGSGNQGYAGDGGPAILADFNGPAAVAVDQFTNVGTVYIADRGNHVVRAVAPDGTINTVVGTGIAGDNAPAPNFEGTWEADALSTHLDHPSSLGVDGVGRLWIADARNGRIVRYDPSTGTLRLVPTTAGALPWGLVVVPLDQLGVTGFDGTLVVYADRGNNQLRFLAEFQREGDATPLLLNQVIAGTGSPGYLDDEDGLKALLEYPRAVIPYIGDDCDACFLLADGFDRVRQLELTLNLPASISASVTTRLGGATAEGVGPFEVATMRSPQHMVPISEDGAYWLASDSAQGTLHLIDFASSQVLIVAGYPEGFTQGENLNRPVYTRKLTDVVQLAYDATQSPPVAYAAIAGEHIIRRLTMPSPTQFAGWTIEDFAGALDTPGFVDGTLQEARFDEPAGLALDAERQILYVAERGNHVVRAIQLQSPDAPDAVSTVAGTPQSLGFFGEGTSAREATLNRPSALAFARERLYIADTDNNRVRYVDEPMREDATIHTLVGDGSSATGGKGPLARTFPVDNPMGVHIDRYGNAFVTSRSAVRSIVAGEDGLADGDDPTDVIYGFGARDRYPEAVTNCLSGASTSLDGATLYVFDACQGLMIELSRQRLSAAP